MLNGTSTAVAKDGKMTLFSQSLYTQQGLKLVIFMFLPPSLTLQASSQYLTLLLSTFFFTFTHYTHTLTKYIYIYFFFPSTSELQKDILLKLLVPVFWLLCPGRFKRYRTSCVFIKASSVCQSISKVYRVST